MTRFTFLLQAALRVQRGSVVELDLLCQRRINSEPFGSPVVYKLRPVMTGIEQNGARDLQTDWVLFDTDGRTELKRWPAGERPMSQISLFAYDAARECELQIQRKANEVVS